MCLKETTILKHSGRRRYLMSIGPEVTSIMVSCGREVLCHSSRGKLGTGSPPSSLLASTVLPPERRRTKRLLVTSWIHFIAMVVFVRAPFGACPLVAAFERYLYTAVDARPGPGGSRTTASCQPEAQRPRTIPLRYSVGWIHFIAMVPSALLSFNNGSCTSEEIRQQNCASRS